MVRDAILVHRFQHPAVHDPEFLGPRAGDIMSTPDHHVFPVPDDHFGVVQPGSSPGDEVVDMVEFSPFVFVGVATEAEVDVILFKEGHQPTAET